MECWWKTIARINKKLIKYGFYCKKAINVEGRKKAISKAISTIAKNDILLIAGKGHENTQEIKGKVSFFDDEVIAKECFYKRISFWVFYGVLQC